MRTGSEIVPLKYVTARKVFLNACKRQGIRPGKRNPMHMFRRSKATHDMADGVPVNFIEARGSWSKGSRALQQCYISVQQRDKDNAYRKKYGVATAGAQERPTELTRCRRCECVMQASEKYCPRCGMPTSAKCLIDRDRVAKWTADLVDREMLSAMIKRIVREELKRS